jgi:putative DNA primase/helicase
MSVDFAARITKRGEWPDGDEARIGNVVVLSSEDAIKDTIVPRLAAAEADLSRVTCLAFVKTNGLSRTFSVQNDLPQLGEKIRKIGDVLFVVIDPITSYLGSKLDSHRTTDVRAALEPLATFAEEFNVCILAITHPAKAPQVKAIHATTGSGAFSAAPRLLFLAIGDPETKGRSLLLAVKNNIGKKADGLGYRIEQCLVGPDEDILASRISWDGLPVRITADQALEQAVEKKRGSATTDATEFLREELDGGPRSAQDINEKAEALNISKRTLERARKKLGITATKDGYQGAWKLKLPERRNPYRDDD